MRAVEHHAVAIGQDHVLETTCCTGYGEERTRHLFIDKKDVKERSAGQSLFGLFVRARSERLNENLALRGIQLARRIGDHHE